MHACMAHRGRRRPPRGASPPSQRCLNSRTCPHALRPVPPQSAQLSLPLSQSAEEKKASGSRASSLAAPSKPPSSEMARQGTNATRAARRLTPWPLWHARHALARDD